MKFTLVGFVLAILASPSLQAQDRSLAGFLGQAEAIFVGRVIEQRSFWDEEHRLIWTDHVFRVEQWLKGDGDPVTVVKELGGTIGDLTLTLSHPVEYRSDSTYLVFAAGRPGQRTVEGELGRLSVLESADGSAFVRLFPQHPLASLADHDGHSLQDLTVLTSRLRERIAP